MTITLRPETEARLHAVAQREGQDMDTLVNQLLEEVLDLPGLSSIDDTEALREGLEAMETGRERPFDEFMADHRARNPGI